MITIVIPVYNGQEWLADSIESALSQDDCEVIVVDDGSTDNSRAIAEGYKDVKVIHQVNKGLPSARNTGIMNATTDYILFLDADDILLDKAVYKLRTLMAQTDADVACGSFKTFGISNELVSLIPNPKIEDFKPGNRLGYSALFKKSVLQEVGGYSPRMVWGWEDLHLWYDLLKRGKKIATTPEVVWLYRTKECSMIHEANEHAEELTNQLTKDFPNI
jgi:glycosyltransferase involved in cell wall biosynthesis